MSLRDVTDYQFATPTRRLLVRQARAEGADADPAEAARRRSEEIAPILGDAAQPTSPTATTAGGAAAATLVVTLPPEPGKPGGARTVRTAFLRFGEGPLVELSLESAADDAGAEAEFDRLLAGIRPATATEPLAAVAQALDAGQACGPDHSAGAVRLDLTPDYRASSTFTLAEGDVCFQLEASAPAEEATRSGLTGTLLGEGVSVAQAEDGRPVRYEMGPTPPLARARGATPEAGPSSYALRGPGGPGGPGEAVVGGNVGGTAVQVRISSRSGDAVPAELGEQLLRDLNARR